MGTNSTTKFIKNASGQLTEQFALTTSAGSGDANAIPALNASGVLDPTIVNGIIVSAGAGSSGKVVQLNASGQLDTTVMPTGIGAATVTMITSEAIAAGAFVNIYNNAGTPTVRNANATTAGKEAHGFCLSAFGSGVTATIYMAGVNTAVTGMTAGPVFLSTSAGVATSTAPSTSGNIVQRIGFATAATAIGLDAQSPITLA